MKSVDGQVMIVVLPDVFRAVVICETCRATIAVGGPVAHPVTAAEGVLTAGFLLGAGADLVGKEQRHYELCKAAAFSFKLEEVARKELPGIGPWLGVDA